MKAYNKFGVGVNWNTRKSMTYCKCGALGVDGRELYLRLVGNEADREEVKRVKKHG